MPNNRGQFQNPSAPNLRDPQQKGDELEKNRKVPPPHNDEHAEFPGSNENEPKQDNNSDQ